MADVIHLMLPLRGGRGIVPACGAETSPVTVTGGSYLLSLVTCEACRASDAGRREAAREADPAPYHVVGSRVGRRHYGATPEAQADRDLDAAHAAAERIAERNARGRFGGWGDDDVTDYDVESGDLADPDDCVRMWRVEWVIELPAVDARSAAMAALARQRDPESLACVFDVVDEAGVTTRVDLLDEEED